MIRLFSKSPRLNLSEGALLAAARTLDPSAACGGSPRLAIMAALRHGNDAPLTMRGKNFGGVIRRKLVLVSGNDRCGKSGILAAWLAQEARAGRKTVLLSDGPGPFRDPRDAWSSGQALSDDGAGVVQEALHALRCLDMSHVQIDRSSLDWRTRDRLAGMILDGCDENVTLGIDNLPVCDEDRALIIRKIETSPGFRAIVTGNEQAISSFEEHPERALVLMRSLSFVGLPSERCTLEPGEFVIRTEAGHDTFWADPVHDSDRSLPDSALLVIDSIESAWQKRPLHDQEERIRAVKAATGYHRWWKK